MANVKVVTYFGGGAAIGETLLVVGQQSNYGTVMEISGGLVRVGSGTSQSSNWLYASDLELKYSDISGLNRYDFPTGVNSLAYNRHLTEPLGHRFNINTMTGWAYSAGNSIVSTHVPT